MNKLSSIDRKIVALKCQTPLIQTAANKADQEKIEINKLKDKFVK